MNMITIRDLFNLEDNIVEQELLKYQYPWEVLPKMQEIILTIGSKLDSEYQKVKENVWIHQTARIGQNVEIVGPCIIMEGTEIRHNAYLRENVIIGPNCVIGNSCEIKNSLLLNNCQIPHFNYVGDSLLGHFVHLGAGAIIANLRLDKKNIVMENIDTGLRKVGALIGDRVEVGANSVICPGTIMMPNSVIYPLVVVKRNVASHEIVKNGDIKVERL